MGQQERILLFDAEADVKQIYWPPKLRDDIEAHLDSKPFDVEIDVCLSLSLSLLLSHSLTLLKP
jgi:hypothetical protein